MKTTLMLLAAVLLVLLTVVFIETVTDDEAFLIADNGRPAARIVIGDQPAESVSFAARELQTYVKKMSGAELPIVAKSEPGKPAILLGNAARGRLPKGDLAGILRDGYLIKVDQGDLCIVGLDDAGAHTDIAALLAKGITHDEAAWNFHRGTLYGVYRLLEELGVRWYLPGKFGERVPARKTLVFSGAIKENPHFISRGGNVSWWTSCKWKGNRSKSYIMPGEGDDIGFTAAESRMWQLRMRGSSFQIPLNHYPNWTRWAERFGKKHPEYFAVYSDGSSSLTSGKHGGFAGHMCYSQPGVVRESVADIQAFAAGADAGTRGLPMTRPDGRVPSGVSSRYPHNRGWPNPIALDDYFSLTPQDDFKTPCACPECAKRIATKAGRQRQYSRLIWEYVARVADGLAGDDVTKRMFVTCLAYSGQCYPYPGMRHLPSNVVVGICVGPYQNPTSWGYGDTLEQYETLLREWAPLTDNPLAFWQHNLTSNRKRGDRETSLGLPEHVPELYAKGLRLMAKYGNHVFCEMINRSIMFELFNRYLLLKLFYDPSLDEREILDDFLNGFYGPDAGPIIGEIYADINRKTVERLSHKYDLGRHNKYSLLSAGSGWGNLFSASTMRDYHRKADLALQKTAGTPYEKAVSAFKEYYLGLMDHGRAYNADILTQLSDTRLADDSDVAVRRAVNPVVPADAANGPFPDFDSAMRAAEALCKEKNHQAAIDAFLALADSRAEPRLRFEAVYAAARCAQSHLGDEAMALELCGRILDEVHVKACRAMVYRRGPVTAVSSAKVLAEFKDEDFSAWPEALAAIGYDVRGTAYFNTTNGAAAARDFAGAFQCALMWNKWSALNKLGNTYRELLHDEVRAEACYRKCMSDFGGGWPGLQARLILGEMLAAQQRHEAALSCFEGAPKAPGNWGVKLLIGAARTHVALGNRGKAAAALEKALKTGGIGKPERKVCRNMLAELR